MVGSGALYKHFKDTSDLIHTGFFSITELENMMPFEKDAYIQMHNAHMESVNNELSNSSSSIANLLK